MKTSAFLALLHANRGRPLFFSLGRGRHVPAGYHLTEVKRVGFETMDCGAMTHAWKETHFELWSSPLPEICPAFMAAEKFLNMVGRVGAQLPLDGDSEAKIYFGDRNAPAALYSVERVVIADGRLEVALTAEQTQCKAATRQLKGLVSNLTSCCSVSGCCGSGSGRPEAAIVDARGAL